MRDNSFMQDNEFALNWTIEEIEKKVNEVVAYLHSEEGKKEIFLTRITSHCDMYPDQWLYFKKIVKKPIGGNKDKESKHSREKRAHVFRMIKKVDGELQGRLVDKGLRMKTSAPLTIFILKNQGWSDQQHLDVTSDGEKIENDGKVEISVINTNPNIKLDAKGKVIEDKTGE